MSHSEILLLQQQEEELQKDIQTLKDALLEEDDPERELVWEGNIRSKENELNDIMERIENIQKRIKENFVKNVINKRNTSFHQNSDTYVNAKKDAEDTVFGWISMTPEEIALRFSTDSFVVKPEPGTQVYPKMVEFRWFHEFKRNNFNDKIVPLSPGVRQPMRYCTKTKRKKKVFFLIDKIYSDKDFITRCNDYYSRYNMSISIEQDKNNRNKFWIVLSVLEDGRLIFP